MPQSSSFLVRTEDVPSYSPANHSLTSNQRLIGPETVGAKHMELVLGTLHKGGGALPHAHPEIEQACYLLEGTAQFTVGNETHQMVPGDTCFFPAGEMHLFTVTSDTPVKLLVFYSPPYGEKPENVIRESRGPSNGPT
ncbi:cupin domain-containing protein [Flavisphingomonas formosensis]|uniref:cupin domain-containing protein n=1 Tax=Flavisphingomonas formosensis TaxID=861534 RepID=UPI0012FA04F0|nr:cupin domain-containing protein [Sphingomonas formosensis]